MMLSKFRFQQLRKMTMMGIVVIATALSMVGCDAVSSNDSASKARDDLQAWRCPAGQVSKAFLVPLLESPVRGGYPTSLLVHASYGQNSDGTMVEQYDQICLDKDQATAFVRQHLPNLHKQIREHNAAVDKSQEEVNRIVATFDAKPDLVVRLFSMIRTACESQHKLPTESYAYTYVTDNSPAMIDRIIAAYREHADMYLNTNGFLSALYNDYPLARGEAPVYGKTGAGQGLIERIGSLYVGVWGDAYERFHTDPSYRQLRAGDFPRRNFNEVLQEEC